MMHAYTKITEAYLNFYIVMLWLFFLIFYTKLRYFITLIKPQQITTNSFWYNFVEELVYLYKNNLTKRDQIHILFTTTLNIISGYKNTRSTIRSTSSKQFTLT